MKNQYIEKINKIGKTGLALARICHVMISIAMVCCIAGSALLALVPSDGVLVTTSHTAQIEMDMTHSIMPRIVSIDTEDDDGFELDGIIYDKLDITGTLAQQTTIAQSTPYTYSLKNMIWVTLCGAVLCVALLYAFSNIKHLFSLFAECETPFTLQIADSFKKLGLSFIPAIVMMWIVEAVTIFVTTGVFDLTIGIDLTVVMIIVVILLMSEIFRYGTMLQTEADETL